MSYNIKPNVGTKSGPIMGNRVQNVESTLRLIKEISSEDGKFYELEPLEILEVHLDDTKNSFPQGSDGPDYTYLGGVKGRFVISEVGLNIDKLNDYKPLNPQIQTTPIIGEIVIGVKYLGQLFYTTQINFFGNPNFNTQHGLSKGKSKDTLVSEKIDTANEQDDTSVNLGYYMTADADARKILPSEGDVIIEGRFGNTIRLGSDIKNENLESPNIILNAGQTKEGDKKVPIKEVIDTDGSSVYITTNQPLEFTPGTASQLTPPPYEGKNILLSSDRIIFNTKNGGDIGLFSNNNISLTAAKEVVIESLVTKIGSIQATEPMVLGAILESKLNDILTLIETGLLAPTGPVIVGPGAPILASLKSTLAQIKSPNNVVE